MMNALSLPVGERLPARKKEWNPPKWMYPIIYNKWKIVFVLLAIVLAVSLFGFGFAGEAYKNRQLGFALDGMIKELFGNSGELESWITINSNLKLSKFASGSADVMGSYITPIYNAFSSVGMVFMLMFWGIGYFDMLMQNNNQMFLEQIVKKLILLVIGMMVIANAKEIVVFCVSLGDAIWRATGFSTAVSGADYSTANAVGKFIKAEFDAASNIFANWGVALTYVVQLFFPWLISVVAGWGVKIFAIARYLEVCIIAAVSPLLFCDVSNAHGGFTHSAAFRGMRQVLALAIQGIVILAGLKLCSAISADIIGPTTGIDSSNFLDIGFAMVAVGLAKLGITAKSQQIARQLVGLG